ncbi:MAG: cysteine desulfurase NifS [Vampirovibrio sp.]|jgi:cysteine desulfurase|nr:cysteine desulfurase NifS [Vampirovibrio sp.]
MLPFLGDEGFGNPSSLHYWGRQARKALEQARETVAACLGAKPVEMIFTSGATEADNLAVFGVVQALSHKGKHIVTTRIEHAAVANACKALEAQGWDITWLPVDAEGFVLLDDVKAAIRPETALVSIIHGNNEIGTIQPVEAIGAYLREQGVLFHMDAVQTVGKLPIDLSALPVDYLSLSAHKLYGPKGVGALYIRDGAPTPQPMMLGGGQEGDLRSGTENLAGIVGLAKALELATADMAEESVRLRALQDWLIAVVLEAVPGAVLNGPRNVRQRVPGNVHFSFPPGEGEALVLHLDLKGIAVSSGSACHSAVIEPSRIVKALGKPDEVAKATVRFSLGRSTTQANLQRVVEVLPDIVKRFQKAATK